MTEWLSNLSHSFFFQYCLDSVIVYWWRRMALPFILRSASICCNLLILHRIWYISTSDWHFCAYIVKMKIKTQGQSTPTTVVKMNGVIVQSLNNMNQWGFHMVLFSNLVLGEADQCLVRLSIWPNWSLSDRQDDQYVDRIFIWSNWSERPRWPIQTETAADLKCSVSLSTGSARLFGSSFFKYLFLQIQSFKSLYLLNWPNCVFFV